MKKIQMVDLNTQFEHIKSEVMSEIEQVIHESAFINGPQVRDFASKLGDFLQVDYVVPCANGTDALQIALMALQLEENDEVIIPAFNYVALAEVIVLLKLKPVFADVHPDFFTLDPQSVRNKITPKTKVIAPVHLFGQAAPMEEIMNIAKEFGLYVIEDNAQAISANYHFSDGTTMALGTIGDIGTTSFFPSKNLGCFGDGGAIFTRNETLFSLMKTIANHGQKTKYYHDMIGVNSRLDTLQAVILNVKLKHLTRYSNERRKAADVYDEAFKHLYPLVQTPARAPYSTHVFHQYTLKVPATLRDELRAYLASEEIPTMLYYPLPLHHQIAYKEDVSLPVSEKLVSDVVSLPMNTEMTSEQLSYITEKVIRFFESATSHATS
jgi:UDP-2-acetamido-2-deoxy-ribo-hexuluronate aminotransferase